MKFKLSRQIFETDPISNFVKIRAVRTELFPFGWTDRRTERHNEINSHF